MRSFSAGLRAETTVPWSRSRRILSGGDGVLTPFARDSSRASRESTARTVFALPGQGHPKLSLRPARDSADLIFAHGEWPVPGKLNRAVAAVHLVTQVGHCRNHRPFSANMPMGVIAVPVCESKSRTSACPCLSSSSWSENLRERPYLRAPSPTCPLGRRQLHCERAPHAPASPIPAARCAVVVG